MFDLWYGDVTLVRVQCTSFVAGQRCPATTTPGAWVGGFTRFRAGLPPPATQGAHDDLGDLVFDTQAANDACPLILASDGGVYRNTDTGADCQNPKFEQPVQTPHALWLLGMSGVHRAGAEAEDLYFGVQDDGVWGTTNAGAATPTWTNPFCCDVFDFGADANRAVFTSCCYAAGTVIFMSGPGLVGAGQLPPASQPPGVIVGFRASEAIARLADKQYVVLTSTGVYITTDITANPVVWTPLAGAPANACAVSVADTKGQPGTPTLYIQAGICNERNMGLSGDQLWRYTGIAAGGSWTRVDNTTDAGLHWLADPKLDVLMIGNGAFRYTTQRGPGNFSTISPALPGAGLLGYPQPSLLAFDPKDPSIVVAGGRDSGVFLSVDGGKTWTLITDPLTSDASGVPNLPRPEFAYVDHQTANSFDLYIGTQGRGVWRFRVNIPAPAPDEGPTGIGASVALAIVDDTTKAEITGTLDGGHDLTLTASTTHATTTHAKTGAAGKIAITPSVGITLSNITTTATVSGGTALGITGSFDATADQTASASTTAEGSAKAKTAAIGASVALTIANHKTEATANRDITAGGSV
ncbi:MAG: hypothetical protein E6G64_17985, partial [Actinobacteria bacterium]